MVTSDREDIARGLRMAGVAIASAVVVAAVVIAAGEAWLGRALADAPAPASRTTLLMTSG